jgi:TPR repeat protein
MKITKYIFLILLCPAILMGQTHEQKDTNLVSVTEAMKYVFAINRPYYPERALEILQKGAQLGLPDYMNALGVYYSEAPGIEPDWKKAAHWYRKAAVKNHPKALYNLGMIYKYGKGVDQDLEKSFLYARLSADKGNQNGQYFAGYMLYKGLGCKQNYEEAMDYLQSSADQDHYPAMYLLGLCYRNGYGVEQDTATARFYLEIAAARGCSFAQEELEIAQPELDVNVGFLKSAKLLEKNLPQSFRQVEHKLSQNSVDGAYSGTLVTYDWSGQHILKETNLKLTLRTENDTLKGQWIQNDSTVVVFSAQLTPEGLIFNDAVVPRTDHYNKYPLMYKFQKATLAVSRAQDQTFLAGNLQMFSQATMEPERPVYLSLSQDGNSDMQNKMQTDESITNLVAFPNPFRNNLMITFSLKDESDVHLSLLNPAGSMVYQASADQLPEGKNKLNVNVDLPAGSYILLLKTKAYSASTMVVKQN